MNETIIGTHEHIPLEYLSCDLVSGKPDPTVVRGDEFSVLYGYSDTKLI